MNFLTQADIALRSFCTGPLWCFLVRPSVYLCLGKGQQATQLVVNTVNLFSIDCFFPGGKWAALGGSAIPRQPMPGTRQASFAQPGSKNQFNI